MAYWIWFPGDFELYHGMKQNFEREERGFFWPAYWKVGSFCHSVKFTAHYVLKEAEEICVRAYGLGNVMVKWRLDRPERPWELKRFPFDKRFTCPAKEIWIEIVVGNIEGLPCIFVEGKHVKSDSTWRVTDYDCEPVCAGYSPLYASPEQNPMVFEYTSRILEPISEKSVKGGVLYDFGREITAQTLVRFKERRCPLSLSYGESEREALDTEFCYMFHKLTPEDDTNIFGGYESELLYRTKNRGFRYIYIDEKSAAKNVDLYAELQFVDFPGRGCFSSDDAELERIWAVAEDTFRLASGIFFMDGIKRDRWIWSGDAYQSYFINRYLFFDKDICRRTILALRGNDPVRGHINTIPDYSMYWIMSIEDYYMMTGDLAFVRMIFPKVRTLMEYCLEQTDEYGFLYGRKNDWIYIDWSVMDKDGPVSAEQMLLARCCQTMVCLCRLMGLTDEAERFEQIRFRLLDNIRRFYWDEAQGAFIDSFTSGKRQVTRHSNIFGILFDFANEYEQQSILRNVLENDQIPEITTPYFKFYELSALAKLGCYDMVMGTIKSYWGGMLREGASTFWEAYIPGQTEEDRYDMYGKKYAKSLCHAWGATPIYLLGRYFFGVYPTAPGYEKFNVCPVIHGLGSFFCRVPAGEGYVTLDNRKGYLEVFSDREGGTLIWKENVIKLQAGSHIICR